MKSFLDTGKLFFFVLHTIKCIGSVIVLHVVSFNNLLAFLINLASLVCYSKIHSTTTLILHWFKKPTDLKHPNKKNTQKTQNQNHLNINSVRLWQSQKVQFSSLNKMKMNSWSNKILQQKSLIETQLNILQLVPFQATHIQRTWQQPKYNKYCKFKHSHVSSKTLRFLLFVCCVFFQIYYSSYKQNKQFPYITNNSFHFQNSFGLFPQTPKEL